VDFCPAPARTGRRPDRLPRRSHGGTGTQGLGGMREIGRSVRHAQQPVLLRTDGCRSVEPMPENDVLACVRNERMGRAFR